MSKKMQWMWKAFAFLMVFLIGFSPLVFRGNALAGKSQPNEITPPARKTLSERINPLDKLDARLRDLVSKSPSAQADQPAPAAPVVIEFYVSRTHPRLMEKMKSLFVDGKMHGYLPELDGNGEGLIPVMSGLIQPKNVLKLAAFTEVERIFLAVIEIEGAPDRFPPDDTAKIVTPKDWAVLQANSVALRGADPDWQDAKAFGDGREGKPQAPNDWFETSWDGPTHAAAAWARGYRGEGVKVAVIDDGVDLAHPDLMGTQEIYSSTVNSQYNGWPYIMDVASMRAWFYDQYYGTTFIHDGFAGVRYVDTSFTPLTRMCTRVNLCFNYTPRIDWGVPGTEHLYYIYPSFTQSGVVHVGTLPDESLRDYVWGEKVAVLVTDPNVAGVYDTVYIDLDNDYTFVDEKPLTRADTTNPATLAATKNNPIAYRDMNGDGLADLSGGALYFIADGVNYIPGTDWLFALPLYGISPPENGDLVAIHGPWESGYSHGTQCASNVVGQGVVNALLPEFADLPPGPGVPPAAVYGIAPEAGLVAMTTYYGFTGGSVWRDSFYAAAYGWDARNQNGLTVYPPVWPNGPDTDGIQVTTNSYGFSDVYNEGWDLRSLVMEDVQRRRAPYLQFLVATGNGGPGYGTVTPPKSTNSIGVGASTEMGSTGWDSITYTSQINFNDLIAFTNSGPSARDGSGAEVVAGGAFAAGAEELNYYSPGTWGVLDGNLSWVSWGGTSRSTPVAGGVLALIYQAYKAAHGVWPTHVQAKALLMSSATDINYDIFKQGAGAVNADIGTLMAEGSEGLYMAAGSHSWTPGDYRGTDYSAFAHLTYPGDYWDKSFTLVNDTDHNINAHFVTTYMELISAEERTLDVTPAMVAGESAYGPANADNFYKAFHYFIPIWGNLPAWENVYIPEATDLMVVREIYPYDQFDLDGDYSWDNRFVLGVYNWQDMNGDGNLWEDFNGNGVVNFINDPAITLIDYGSELIWGDPRTELDRWEFERFSYNRGVANTYEVTVQDPRHRMQDGIFIGLRHLFNESAEGITTNLRFRFEFYKRAEVDWLDTNVTGLTVPAYETANFTGIVNVPVSMEPGDYAAAIEVLYEGPAPADPNIPSPYPEYDIIIPVTLHVADKFDGDNTFGGWDAFNQDASTNYNNGAVRGYYDWSWRPESGDTRFFYMDVENPQVLDPVYLSESFDSGIPGTWSVWQDSGAGTWEAGSACGDPNYTGGSGDYATANSDCHMGDFDTWLSTPSIDLSTATNPYLVFNSDFWDWAYDEAMIHVSTDGGGTWSAPLVDWTSDRYASHEQISLGAYAGLSDVRVAFHYTTNGEVWQGWWQIDDVQVGDLSQLFDPDGHFILKDEWEGPAPHNDLDSIVLGPTTPHPLSPFTFGAWSSNGYSSSYYGPYTLDVRAMSVDDRVGYGVWRFNTTSGANEDWLFFPFKEGLHELINHNVLFEGDQFSTVFTKTVGLLSEDAHQLYTETYFDQGYLGQVNLESTLALDGMVASGYLFHDEEQFWDEEPITFAGDDIEWFYPFSLSGASSLYLETSSSDLADIDLYLYYCDPGCGLYAYSAGATDVEWLFISNPPDGDWLIGVDNWSGPGAGHFDLFKVVQLNIGGITTTVTPSGPLAANTPVAVDVWYDAPLALGENWGVLYVGPEGAPYMKAIDLIIFKWAGVWMPLLFHQP